MKPRLTIVVPAANEENFIADALQSIAIQDIQPAEVIVVVNGSTDRTEHIAREKGAVCIVSKKLLGYSGAREAGAKKAQGDILVFLDADSEMGPGVLRAISNTAPRTYGTVMGNPIGGRLSHKLFFLFKNVWHRLGFYKGVLGGLLFVHKQLYDDAGGFRAECTMDEYFDLTKRLVAKGGKYQLLTRVWARTSVRRFEEQGMLRLFIFWIRLRISYLFNMQHEVGREYGVYHKK